MSEYLWCIRRSPFLILGDELRFLSGWYQSLVSGRPHSCLPPGYKSTFTYSLLSGFLSAKKKKKNVSHTFKLPENRGNGISCWIHLVLHRAQSQCWGELVCLPEVICLPFPWSIRMGPGSSLGALEQRDRERKTPSTLCECKLAEVASVLKVAHGCWASATQLLSFFPWG